MNLSLMSGSQRDESIRPGELEDSLHFTNTNKYKQPTSSTFETQHQQEDQRQTSNMPTFAADERYQRPLTVNADSVPVALGPASADSGYRTSNCGSAALAGPISAGSYKSTRSTNSGKLFQLTMYRIFTVGSAVNESCNFLSLANRRKAS